MKNKIQEVLAPPVNAYKCHQCGKALRPDANFCSSCGLKVVKATPTTGTVTKAKGGLETTSDPRGFVNGATIDEAIIDQLAESIYKKVVVKIHRF